MTTQPKLRRVLLCWEGAAFVLGGSDYGDAEARGGAEIVKSPFTRMFASRKDHDF